MKLLRVDSEETPEQFRMKRAPDYLRVDPSSGIYWVDIFRKDKNPPRLSRSTKTSSKTLAVTRAQDMVAKWLGENPLTGEKRKVPFTEICNEVMAAYEASVKSKTRRASTLEMAKIYIKKNAIEFGHLYFDPNSEDPSAPFVAAWKRFVVYFQNSHPEMTLYNHWKYMCALMKHAFDLGYTRKPWTVKNPDSKRDTGRVLSEGEKEALLRIAKPNLRDPLIMAMTMGMRRGEILKLEWNRVNFNARTIHLRAIDTKTKRPRTMRMSPQVYGMLLNRRAGYYRHGRGQSDLFVFPSPGNPKAPRGDLRTAWKSTKKAAGIDETPKPEGGPGRCRFHHLRHTFLTECAKLVKEGHVSVVLVCSYAGLKIETFERVYLHLNHEDTAKVSELVAVKLPESTSVAEVRH